jgi:hypothetical protein
MASSSQIKVGIFKGTCIKVSQLGYTCATVTLEDVLITLCSMGVISSIIAFL